MCFLSIAISPYASSMAYMIDLSDVRHTGAGRAAFKFLSYFYLMPGIMSKAWSGTPFKYISIVCSIREAGYVYAVNNARHRIIEAQDYLDVWNKGRYHITNIIVKYKGSSSSGYANYQGCYLPGYYPYYPRAGYIDLYDKELGYITERFALILRFKSYSNIL